MTIRTPPLPVAWCALVLLSWVSVDSRAATEAAGPAAHRIVSADGAITEILYALGAEGRLVGVDTTSRFPPRAADLPDIGYKRALSAEGILALTPELLLATDDAGPPEVLAQIVAAGVAVHRIPNEPTVEGLIEKVRGVAGVLAMEEAGTRLVARIQSELTNAEASAVALTDAEPPGVLFLLHAGSGADLCAGRDTAADTLIQLAGGRNVMRDGFSGYKPLSSEAALAAAPDIILLTERNLDALGGIDGVLGRAGLAATPAGQEKRVLAMDGALLLAFGPRLPEAVAALARRMAERMRDSPAAAHAVTNPPAATGPTVSTRGSGAPP